MKENLQVNVNGLGFSLNLYSKSMVKVDASRMGWVWGRCLSNSSGKLMHMGWGWGLGGDYDIQVEC